MVDTTTAPTCVSGSAVCQPNCIPDPCYTTERCQVDYSKCSLISYPTTTVTSSAATTIYVGVSNAAVTSTTNSLILLGFNPTVSTSIPTDCPATGSSTGSSTPATPIEQIAANANDASTVAAATTALATAYANTKAAISATTGTPLLSDFTMVVVAITSNGNAVTPSVDITVQLVPVTGVALTPAHLTAYCDFLEVNVYPVITKYTAADFVSCVMTPVTTQKRAVSQTSSTYTASATPSSSAVASVYGSSSSASSVCVSFIAMVSFIALFFFKQ